VFDPRECPSGNYGKGCFWCLAMCEDSSKFHCPADIDIVLHPDFAIPNGVWFRQNRYGTVACRENSKVCFTFTDLSLMDDCPFVAKIGFNKYNGHRYFGVAYAESPEELDQIRAWSTRFENARETKYAS
jgi:hypothetical protein